MIKQLINYLKKMLEDRGGTPNTKLHFGSIFAVVLIIGLFVGVDASLYQTFAFCTLALFGISAVDNLSAPKVVISKTENTTKETKTEIDVAKTINAVKGKK